jgi:hypothetical protein
MKRILIIFLFIISITACCENRLPDRLDIPIHYKDDIKANLHSEKCIIYYHTGDCSICFGTLLEISDEFPDLNIVSITSSQNKLLLEYQLEKIRFKGISLNDADSSFFKQNQNVLFKGNLFLVDSVYHILVLSRGFNNDFRNNVNRQLGKEF